MEQLPSRIGVNFQHVKQERWFKNSGTSADKKNVHRRVMGVLPSPGNHAIHSFDLDHLAFIMAPWPRIHLLGVAVAV